MEEESLRPQTAAQIKQRLWREGSSLKDWAARHGYSYSTVSAVMSGKIKVARNYGVGFEIALRLGLVVEDERGGVIHGERSR